MNAALIFSLKQVPLNNLCTDDILSDYEAMFNDIFMDISEILRKINHDNLAWIEKPWNANAVRSACR
ncbi:MAG: hypothetical protein LUI15_08420, partial [Firmicutes bacterium]|nr:hypothetical protein [Bacillota bacterium]